MPGFAVTSSISASEGKALSAAVPNIGKVATLILTATKKSRITNLTANNVEGGILPLTVFVRRNGVDTVIVNKSRVFKEKALIMSLTSDDPRVGADKMQDLPHTEVVLLPGDSLYAVSPLDNSFDVVVTYFEGIS